MAKPFDFDIYVHGFCILGAIFFFAGAFIAGNVEWVEGTTQSSFWLAALLAFVMFVLAGFLWVSAAVNARQEER
ncbi:MAG: hypothetical protein HYY37_06335 [Candidatus Aenigmarchaeota archaeon]|nr:hypothetical protein [Candidatus Aenigmarchaeota archaeon]